MTAYMIAHLSVEESDMIQDLERELKVCALAVEPGLELAELSEEELARVREVEEELGVNLIIYSEC
jgi:hypothetical protein